METLTAPVITEFDTYLWGAKEYYHAYDKLGAHLGELDGVAGCHFAIWAPHARHVAVMTQLNGWSKGADVLRKHATTGIWSGFIPGVGQGEPYKYYILGQNGYETERCDPFGFWAELRPQTASRVFDLGNYEWSDAEWLEQRKGLDIRKAALNIYEVHLGSWMRGDKNRWLTYREMADRLGDHVAGMGYTHIELLPVKEHPYDGSWGYQTLGYFAPTSRFGTPDDFRYFVDKMHQRGIGVILDWVPAHFPRDGHGLSFFDGTHLYEHADPRKGAHPDWGTLIFNYGRNEVKNFLISSALFWLKEYHLDGLRVDAVASMLYLDYGRKQGEWLPNPYGGRENLEAVQFLKDFNQAVLAHHPDCFTMAEESTAWPGVTKPVEDGGLGFTLKWNMGWMHDTLKYMELDPLFRKHHHHKLTFAMFYNYAESYMLPLSHDEVVHLKKSILSKMPGDEWKMRANLRSLYAYMMGHPGKKLLFMGSEFGQWKEWNDAGPLDWHLLGEDAHRGLLEWSKALNHLYKNEKALWQLDNHPDGFEWVECDDADSSTYSFLRYPEGREEALLFVVNFTPVPRAQHRVGLPWGGDWERVLSSDALEFGGAGMLVPEKLTVEEVEFNRRPQSALMAVPPLAAVIYRSKKPAPPAVQDKLLPVRAKLVKAVEIAL